MKKKIINILKVVCIIFALFCNIENVYKLDFKNLFYIELFSLAIISIIIYYIINKNNNKSCTSIKVISILFSIFFILGNSYNLANSWKLVFGSIQNIIISIIMFVGWYIIFNYILKYIYNYLDKYKIKERKYTNKLYNLFISHPFIFSFFTILIGWLIYIIAFYPAILSPDPSWQIKQFMGMYTKYMDYIIPLDNSVTITNHHPLIHTLLLGSCVKLGNMLGNDNLGFFIYSFIQVVTLALCLSYTIKYMFKIGTSKRAIICFLMIYTLVPVFPLYAMSSVKDVFFTCFVILFNIILYDITKFNDKLNIYKIIKFIIVMMLVILFRNNGIYVILISLIFVTILNKNRRKLSIALLVFMFLFNFTYNKILLPHYKISAGSIREVLSIPFQQTARYVKYDYEKLDSDEIKAIDKVLGIDDLSSRYKEDISDPVKNEFNKYATNEDLKNYFKAWAKGFIKSPNTYIEATINNTYGYFYPNKTRWYVYYDYYDILDDANIDYNYNKLDKLRNVLSGYAVSFPYIPVIGLIVNIAFNSLLLIVMLAYMIHKRNKNIIFLIPSFVSLLVCIASPVNVYFRYAMPYIFMMPTLISIFLHVINLNKKS